VPGNVVKLCLECLIYLLNGNKNAGRRKNKRKNKIVKIYANLLRQDDFHCILLLKYFTTAPSLWSSRITLPTSGRRFMYVSPRCNKKEKGLVRKGTVQEATAEGCNFLKTSNYPKSGIKNFPFRLRPIGWQFAIQYSNVTLFFFEKAYFLDPFDILKQHTLFTPFSNLYIYIYFKWFFEKLKVYQLPFITKKLS